MITIEKTRRIADMAKIEIEEDELSKICSELTKMAGFAREINAVADSIEEQSDITANNIRAEEREKCEMGDYDLSDCGMHIKDGFFRIEAGSRK